MECNLVLLNAKFGRWSGSERDTSAITTVGQVVTAGAELMRIVPDVGSLEIEAYLPNRDIGFVSPGQPAVIKIEAFPFTRYGILNGKVTRVATDATDSSKDHHELPKPPASTAGTVFRTWFVGIWEDSFPKQRPNS